MPAPKKLAPGEYQRVLPFAATQPFYDSTVMYWTQQTQYTNLVPTANAFAFRAEADTIFESILLAFDLFWEGFRGVTTFKRNDTPLSMPNSNFQTLPMGDTLANMMPLNITLHQGDEFLITHTAVLNTHWPIAFSVVVIRGWFIE